MPSRSTRLGFLFVKRLFDIVFSLLVLVLLSWVYLLAALAVKLDDPKGSVLYGQRRIGRGGKPIRVWKFRSMASDADDVAKYLNPEQMRQWKVERKVDDDPRITRVGKFLRATSLDEMPQFANVLTGSLSVIGPRPITEDELTQHFTSEERRELLSMRPGITGLWQAGERNGATFETGRRQQIELSYVREASLKLDAKVFFMTFGAMFGKGRTGR